MLNTPPVANDQTAQTRIDRAVGIDLDASDKILDDVLTFVIVDLRPTAASNAISTSVPVTYLPDLGYEGPDSLQVEANDGLADSNIATFSITVSAASSTPPVAVDDEYSVAEVSLAQLDVTSNDIDDFGVTTITEYQNPSAQGGSVDCSNGFTRVYGPSQGFTGTDTFTYTIEDDNDQSDTATVTVIVAPCPDLTGALGDAGIVSDHEWVACSSTTAHAARGSNLTPLFTPVGSTLALMTSGDAALADGPNDFPSAGRDNGTLLRGAFDVSILRVELPGATGDGPPRIQRHVRQRGISRVRRIALQRRLCGRTPTRPPGPSAAPRSRPADNFAFDLAGDVISVNSSFFDADRVETDNGMQYDGATAVLQAQTPVTPGRAQPLPVDLRCRRPRLRLGGPHRRPAGLRGG